MEPIERINKSVEKLSKIKLFDLTSFSFNFSRMVDNLCFFYNNLCSSCKDFNDTSKVKYKLPKFQKPKEGQVAFFYIENSYPKEIYNSHWCLVLKDFGQTMLVVPMTSIKSNSPELYEPTEIDVKIKNFENNGMSRLHIDQIFSADIMRIDKSKSIYDLEDDFKLVSDKILKKISLKPIDNSTELCYNVNGE